MIQIPIRHDELVILIKHWAGIIQRPDLWKEDLGLTIDRLIELRKHLEEFE